jgi:hypothetical protein
MTEEEREAWDSGGPAECIFAVQNGLLVCIQHQDHMPNLSPARR